MKHNDANYEEILQSIKDIFPKKLMLSKDEVIQITGRSLSSINRDISEGKGIPFKKSRNRVFFLSLPWHNISLILLKWCRLNHGKINKRL